MDSYLESLNCPTPCMAALLSRNQTIAPIKSSKRITPIIIPAIAPPLSPAVGGATRLEVEFVVEVVFVVDVCADETWLVDEADAFDVVGTDVVCVVVPTVDAVDAAVPTVD